MDDAPAGLGEPHTYQQRPAKRAGVMGSTVASDEPWTDDGPVDVDTCRICRGEATDNEPLFYPCKCSGSIKYVHQDCLMEWLSHSQKKHCELCKTPFRFTKLYSPDMPKHLPFHIFVHHMTRYLIRNFLVWLRAALVTSVWLGWLPYLMRSIWSFLFWISDEGFSGTMVLLDPRNSSPLPATNGLSVTVTGSTMCPSTPLLATATTPASLGGAMDQHYISTLIKAVTKTPNTGAPHSWLRALFGLSSPIQISSQEFINNTNATLMHRITKTALSDPRRSILSDVEFLQHLTRNPAVNRIIIHVLEGQIITLLAIICFILIILVRDYVVQQQPEINMRAAFAAAEDAENDMIPPHVVEPLPPAPPPLFPLPVPATPQLEIPIHDTDSDTEDSDQDEAGNTDQNNDQFITGSYDEHRDRGLRPTEPIPEIVRPNIRQRPMVGMGRRPILNIPDQTQLSRGSSPVSPRSPRGLFEDSQSSLLREPSPLGIDRDRDGSSGRTTIGEYVRIYRAADGDNDKIREIIREEGLDEARFSRFLHNRSTSPSSMVAEKACSDSSSWTWAGSDDENEGTSSGALNKGKGRADGMSSKQQIPAPSNSQPILNNQTRATPNELRPLETINPLATNSWSFSNLPPTVTPQPQDTDGDGVGSETMPPEIQIGIIADVSDEPTETLIDSPTSAVPPSDRQLSLNLASPSEDENTMAGRIDTDDGNSHADTPRPVMINDDEGSGTHTTNPEAEARRIIAPPQQPNTIADRVADFMWRDIPPADADGANQEAVDIFGDNQNPPFMHGGHGGDGGEDEQGEDEIAPDVVEAAVAAGLDPEAVEEAEDFDGIMELIGMRGPLAGLFQNAVFCAFLVSISIFIGIFVPYNIGRLAAWVLANPTRLINILFSFAKFVQDAALLLLGYTSTFVLNIFEAFRLLVGANHGKQLLRMMRLDARQITAGAMDRIASSFMPDMYAPSTNEIRNFSAISHQALLELKGNIRYFILLVGDILLYIFGGGYLAKWSGIVDLWTTTSASSVDLVHLLYVSLRPQTWSLDLPSPVSYPPLDASLAYWGAQDRSLAILLGYASLTLLAALYLGRGATFSTGQAAREWEASIIDALNQASGVMKVILIISIEMLVFPLYCGLLLDLALLPLFEDTTLTSRLVFAYNYPLTSIFVHWFIGTGYMFHFALFVSMCRKIMRKGVLYFIRDPDDPDFHPVRDVLERNVTTQLRKILFSAFVYGALVVVCLGGVVWGLSITLPSVLPIHYTYNEPVLEFPVDLLFCNFLMPLAVKFFKPSDGLHTMYTWWFRQCARGLRLTWFLFGERRVEEEGKLVENTDSSKYSFSSIRAMFLDVGPENEVALKSWGNFFSDGDLKPATTISKEQMSELNGRKKSLVESGKLVPDGRFVHSPSSDQAKITKGHSVFTDVSEDEMIRTFEHRTGRPATDTQSENQFQVVYIPPWFRARISIFILSIWIFAAVTGVGSTILPLVLGRHIFKALVPPHIRTNDIYAFSIGVYVLSSASYLVFHLHSAYSMVTETAKSIANSIFDRNALQRVIGLGYRTMRLAYAYSMLLVVFPILITALVEMYILIPLHTYMGTGGSLRVEDGQDGHTVRIIQAWTLGILYLKLGSRALTLYGGRPSHAVRAVLRQGWLQPDIGVLTRAFVIPGFAASAVMLLIPPMFAWVTLHWIFDGATTKVSYEMQVSAYRLAYPLTALFWAALVMLRRVFRVFEGWQVRIRDEAYLMGERLHNFTGAATKASAWRGSTRM